MYEFAEGDFVSHDDHFALVLERDQIADQSVGFQERVQELEQEVRDAVALFAHAAPGDELPDYQAVDLWCDAVKNWLIRNEHLIVPVDPTHEQVATPEGESKWCPLHKKLHGNCIDALDPSDRDGAFRND
jgi:hypothetical protein